MSDFKVGDLIFDITKDPIPFLMEVIDISNDLCSAVGSNCEITFDLKENWSMSRYARHATQKEIEQGFRDE